MYNVPFEFIVDTDSYAGNFERELCAYMTGHWDGETHGGNQADAFRKEIGDPEKLFEGYITTTLTQDDDVPIRAYECLELEPNSKDYNSVGIFFDQEPTPELITLMKNRAYKFAKEGRIFDRHVTLKILGFRLSRRIVKIEEWKL